MALTKCGECGRQISDKAAACPGCGAPLNVSEPTQTVTAVPPPQKKTGCGTMILAAVGILLLVSWIGSLLDSDSSGKRPDPANQDHSWDAAYTCQGFVKKRLKAPSTADFTAKYDATRDPKDRNKYTIISYVEAQNSFGAQLRSNYVCTLRLSGNTWYLQDLQIAP